MGLATTSLQSSSFDGATASASPLPSPSLSLGGSLFYALEALARGEVVALIDEARDLADLVAAADLVTGRTINFMAVHGRGLTSLALPAPRVDELRLAPMAAGWDLPRHGATVSIEARHGVTTGISAPDRAHTIRVAVSEGATAFDIISPGHVFPLRVEESALGQPRTRGEVALSLLQLAGHGRGAVLCEILDDAGERAREDEILRLSQRWSLRRVSHRDVHEAAQRWGHLSVDVGELLTPAQQR